MFSAAFFFPVCSFLVLLGIFIDPRRNDGAQRWLCRVVMKLAGVDVVVRRAPGFDPQRTCFLLSNHVNLFDPFPSVCHGAAIFSRPGTESHFKIPVYGWMMKRFGNVPVPDVNRPSDLKRMWRLDARRARLRSESRRVSRRVSARSTATSAKFKEGVFRMALHWYAHRAG